MEIRTPYDVEYKIDNDLRQKMDAFARMEMSKTNLFTEEEINELFIFVETWMCLDMELRTGMSPNKAGELLGVAGKTVRSWIKKGKIKGYRTIGGYFLVPYQEIVRLKSERTS